MNWLALAAAATKLMTALTKLLSDRRLLAAGEAEGRAASERAQARATAKAANAMREIAERPASRDEAIERLEQGKG
jgi:hypothetical protein